jgi:hypothetical protein
MYRQMCTVVHQSMRTADKPSSDIVLAASHILLMYLSDNVYRLRKQEVVRPSHGHVTERFLIWTLPLSDKLGLQLSNNQPKCILALLYARRSHIYNNMVQLCLVAPGYSSSSPSDSSPSVSVFIPLRSPLKSSISSSETVGAIETLAFCLLHVG